MSESDTTVRPSLESAIRHLASVCDGAIALDGHGFNGADSSLGHALAGIPEARWSPRQRFTAHRMLRKYTGQIAAVGIDYDAIPPPPTPPSLRVGDLIGQNPEEQIHGQTPEANPRAQHARGMARGPHHAGESADELAGLPDGDPRLDHVSGLRDSEDGLRSPGAEVRPDDPSRGGPDSRRGGLGGDHDGSPPLTAHQVLGEGGIIARRLPGYEHRDQQLDMADLVERALAEDLHAIVEAGTGTGKSMAYLVPAILSGKRVLVSTADKSLQAQIVGKDIPFLQSVMPRPFTAVLLKGRGNYLCLYHLREAEQQQALPGFDGFRSQEAVAAWPTLQAWAADTQDGDIEAAPFIVPGDLRELVTADADSCIGERCPHRAACFSERAKAAAKTADVVVVNHALLLRDLEIRYQSEGHASVVPDVQAIVLDEAHHLEEIATDAFGADVSLGRWHRARSRLDRLTVKHRAAAAADARAEAESWSVRADAVQVAMNALIVTIGDRLSKANVSTARLGDERPLGTAAVAGLADLAEAMEEGTPAWLEAAERESWRKLRDSVAKLANNLQAAIDPSFNEGTIRYAELVRVGRASLPVLHVKPIEVADELRERLWRMHTGDGEVVPVVATSATIATDRGMRYWRDRVGCDEAQELIVGSPFDYARNAVLYLPADGAAFDPSQHRQDGSVEYHDRLAAEIERLILASDGRAFCLFTSFRVLEEVYRRLSPRLQRYLVLRQGDLPRPELVRQFRDDGRAVLFGVKSFWEGVDVQGEALSLVVIDKLPFAPPDDPVWEAKCEAVNTRRGDRWAWFNELAIPNAVIALKQGFGRLVRTKSDRGVVAILDGRLVTKGYGTRIVRALPPATQTRSIDAVRAFFSAGNSDA